MEMTTAEAAVRLGVSQRQIQRLAAAGQITPTRRVGRTILVDASDMLVLHNADRRPGRPWTPPVAWAALWQLSGLEIAWLDTQTRRRLLQRLDGISVDELLWACRQRAHVARYRSSASYLDALRNRVRPTSASALDPARDLMTPTSNVDGYCTPSEHDIFIGEFSIVGDPTGNVTLRTTAVPTVAAWERHMPDAVVYADLAESADPRQRSIGRTRLEGLLR